MRICLRRQRGVAAIEFALVLPVLAIVLVMIVFFGRLYWHQSVALKAANDVAVFLATAPRLEMAVRKADYSELDIVRFARTIGETEVAELKPEDEIHPPVDISCDGFTCRGDTVPGEIGVLVRMSVVDPIFPHFINDYLEENSIYLHAEVRVQYVGN